MSGARTISILFAGDMMFNREYLLPPHDDRDPAFYFSEVRESFAEADLVVGNLESTLCRGGAPLRPGTGFQLYSPPDKMIPILRYLEFDVLSLGNNHMDDFGGESLIKTKRLLSEKGFKSFGVGENQADSRKPLKVSKKNLCIGFVGYTTDTARDGVSPDIGAAISTADTPGGNYYDARNIREDVEKLRSEVDIVCVSLHWGYEYFRYPSPKQIELAHDIIDAGADIIFGHHPHCMQGIEHYHNGVILYSLGNFFFWNYGKRLGHPLHGNSFAIALCGVGPDGITVDVIPGEMDKDNRLRVLEDSGAFHEKLREYSERLSLPEYEAFWEQYRDDTEAYLRRVALEHASTFIGSPSEMAAAIGKIKKRGLRYAIGRVMAKLYAKVRLLRSK